MQCFLRVRQCIVTEYDIKLQDIYQGGKTLVNTSSISRYICFVVQEVILKCDTSNFPRAVRSVHLYVNK